jgi:hypothetical protein
VDSPTKPDVARCTATRRGEPRPFELLDRFLAQRELTDVERLFTETFVSNPKSGETVKGPAIVLAQLLGLCQYVVLIAEPAKRAF